MFARMGTPLPVFLFLIVLIPLFNVHQAEELKRTCTTWQKGFTQSPSSWSNGHLTNKTRFIGGKPICCPGYEKSKKYPFDCISTCLKTCTNGICSSPSVCECNHGYKLDLNNKYNCLPICSTPCGNGTCIAPDNCLCSKGYTFANKTCQPICTKPCVNGTCIAPDLCQCLAGFQESDENICKPHCSSECPHGTCVGPDICSCNSGWKMIQVNDTKTCEPICSKPCINGTCIAPETCECDSGYVESEKNVCRPHCSNGCIHGVCVNPETCICDSGWNMTQTQLSTSNRTCQPICTEPCVNGTCVAPETCKCLAGYTKLEKNICEPHCSGGCTHGICVSPGICICDPGWYSSNLNSTCVADTIEFDKNTGVKDCKGYTYANKTCQPFCTEPCVNGTCVAPETCKCLAGYTQLEKNICEPHCSGGCTHGICVSPGICVCDPGWYSSNLNSTCVADTKEFDKNTGVKDWVQSNSKILAPAISFLVLAVIIIIIVIRCKRNKSHKDDGTVDHPAQEFSLNVFKKAKGAYDVCNKNSVL